MVLLVISNVLGFPLTAVPRRQSVLRPAYAGSVENEQYSDLVLHVGNLDWNISPEEISSMLSKAVPNAAQVEVKGLPLPIRKRDSAKLHGGSAAVTFQSQEEAALGIVDLKAYSNTIIPVEKQFRVRWASIVVPSEEKSDAQEPLSPERIELRKNRAESYARRRQRIAAKTDEVFDSLLLMGDNRSSFLDDVPVLDAPQLNWSACHEEVDPIRGGGLKEGTARGERKRAAVEAFLHVLEAALLDNDDKQDQTDQRIVADLGSGAGNLSLPLAWWLKKAGYGVVAVDINAHALLRLDRRAETAGVPNIATAEHDLLDLISGKHDNKPVVDQLSDCAAVVSLHACGAASDLAMSVAVSHSLPFAISPCCIGKLNSVILPGRMPALSNERSAAPEEITYPRSEWLIGAVSYSSYTLLSSAADYGVGNSADAENNEEQERRRRCKLSKRIVEMDRLQWAKERGYHVRLVELPRIGPLYPKRELLLGAKIGSIAATKIAQLATTT